MTTIKLIFKHRTAHLKVEQLFFLNYSLQGFTLLQNYNDFIFC